MSHLRMKEKSVLVGFCHLPNQKPYLAIDTMEAGITNRSLIPIWQQYICLTPLNSSYCIGGYDPLSRQHKPCATQSQVNPNHTQCYTCSTSNWFNPTFYHLSPSQLSTVQQAYNLQPHSVYLAYFYKNKIKVGISHASRMHRRWLEQGARAAVRLQTFPDAYQARNLEKLINTTWKIPEHLQPSQKRKALHLRYNFLEAHQQLNDLRNNIHLSTLNIETTAPIVDLQLAYFSTKEPATLYDTPSHKGFLCEGKGLTLLGDQLIYKKGDYHFVQFLKPLLGKAGISLIPEDNPPSYPLALQTKLILP